MEEDDWSLKSCRLMSENPGAIHGRLGYEIEDIGILRKKLIGDIEKEFGNFQSVSSEQLTIIAKEIINKRFGVER